MNVILNSTRASAPTAYGFSTYFTQDSRASLNVPARASLSTGRYATEVSVMDHWKIRSRAPYARVLYAAAVAALLSACSPADVEPASKATTIQLSETVPDMPEVVVTASRERPKAIG
jgi:hypothetical protein